jgi:hypothetical protein
VEYAAGGVGFKEVVAHRSWARASLGAVRELLGHEWLSVQSEDEVLSAALTWAEAAEGGADALVEVLSVVRLPLVSGAALARLRLHALVACSVACMQLLAEASAWAPSSVDEAGGRLWGPRAAFRSLVVVGEFWAQRYDAATSRWTDLPPPPTETRNAAAASLGGRVYLAGGEVFDEEDDETVEVIAHVTCFDPAPADGADAWAAVAPMGTTRRYAAAASLNGFLFVSGGDVYDDEALSSVERYSPASDAWEAVASMTSGRSSHQLLALGGFLYAIGGWDNNGARVATAERYDPAANTWTPIASMARGRCLFAAAAMGGFLYVTGGVKGPATGPHVVLRSCERYDPASNTWSRIADLPEPRSCHALACLDGSLFAVGGQAKWGPGPPSTSPPWRYDAIVHTWVEVPMAAGSVPMERFDVEGAWAAL